MLAQSAAQQALLSAKRQAVDAKERSTFVDSMSPGRPKNKFIRDKPRDSRAERRGCVDGPSATGSSSSAVAIRDSVYAMGVLRKGRRRSPSSRPEYRGVCPESFYSLVVTLTSPWRPRLGAWQHRPSQQRLLSCRLREHYRRRSLSRYIPR